MPSIKHTLVPYGHYGLKFRDGQLVGILDPGRYWSASLHGTLEIKLFSASNPWLELSQPEAAQLRGNTRFQELGALVELTDRERALVWVDGIFRGVLQDGITAYWKTHAKVRVEILDISEAKLPDTYLDNVYGHLRSLALFDRYIVEDNSVGVLYENGHYSRLLEPGRYLYWKKVGSRKLYTYETRERTLDISGQDIISADKVSLRLNAVLSYRTVDVRKAAEVSTAVDKALYRESQLILRSEIGRRTVDQILADKELIASDALEQLRTQAQIYGIEVKSLGIRDLILPGDMKELFNKVIEAQKASEANVIKRREETAALRSQLNSAKLIEQNPSLLRLRELEAAERIAEKANLQILVGDGSDLSKRVTKLI